MYKKEEATIKKNKHQFTKINFKPDLKRFKLKSKYSGYTTTGRLSGINIQ